jgi:hypothetical protein
MDAAAAISDTYLTLVARGSIRIELELELDCFVSSVLKSEFSDLSLILPCMGT